MHSVLTSDQFKAVMSMLSIAFPNFKFDHNKPLQVDVWYGALSDLEPNKLALAIKSIISTHEFAPSIATIRKKYAEMDMPEKVDTEEAFGLVMRAIRNFGYMRADEAMASLPPQVQKAVMWMGGFKMICKSENLDVTRGQFNKAMASVNTREHTNKALGEGLLEQITHNTAKAEPRYIEHQQQRHMRISNEESLEYMSNVKEVLRQVCGQ